MSNPLRIFIGTDPKQPVAWVVLANSIARHSSVPVEITPLVLKQLPIKRRGLTEFTFSRFVSPWLCRYGGRALFLDADMVVTGDIAELAESLDYIRHSVYVVQKQPRFEWPSAMLFNCRYCTQLTPEYIDDPKNNPFDLSWADHGIGELPPEWNVLCGYGEERMDGKLYHFTRGLPVWPETRGQCPQDSIWVKEAKIAGSTCTYQELMGTSVHEHARKVSNAHQ
jgi:hypothetical protein